MHFDILKLAAGEKQEQYKSFRDFLFFCAAKGKDKSNFSINTLVLWKST